MGSSDAGPETNHARRPAARQHGAIDLQIRPEQPGDHAAVRTVVSAAFGSDAEADLVDRIRASVEYVPELALVAVLDGSIVGHVMISGAELRTRAGSRAIAMLSPLAVAPAKQGRGIGGALVRDATVRASRLGHPFVVLEGSPEYYGRFGFEPASRHGVSLPLPDWAPETAGQILPLDSFDAEALSDGGRVVYPVAFDGLD